MTTLDAVAADLGHAAHRLDGLADVVDDLRVEVRQSRDLLIRIEEAQRIGGVAAAEHRARMDPIPERLARVEEATDANARAIEALDGRNWDRWIAAARGLLDVLVGPGGFLRSAPGIAVLVIVAVAVGWLTLEQAMALRSYVPTLVPVPIPTP